VYKRQVERYLSEGMSPKEAAHKTMDEVSGALVAIGLVLSAVFIPAAFIEGISGQFFRQFAVAIATATLISVLVSLTLSPALAALLLKPHSEHSAPKGPLGRIWAAITWPFARFGQGFNWVFERLAGGYAFTVRRLLRVAALVLAGYAVLLWATGVQFGRAPTGFIPEQNQGYLMTVIQLPPGSCWQRTDAVVQRATEIILEHPGTAHTEGFSGFDGATFTNAPNSGAIFFTFKDFGELARLGYDQQKILQEVQGALFQIK